MGNKQREIVKEKETVKCLNKNFIETPSHFVYLNLFFVSLYGSS